MPKHLLLILVLFTVTEPAHAESPHRSLPSPIISAYHFPMSYDVSYRGQLPSVSAMKSYTKENSPDFLTWSMSTPNIVTWNPEHHAPKGQEAKVIYDFWHKRGKILLYNFALGMNDFGKIQSATEIYEKYREAISRPYVDGISIDEYGLTWSCWEGQETATYAVIEALGKLRAEFPDKIITCWLAGWWHPDWDSPMLRDFAECLRDNMDYIQMMFYLRESQCPDMKFPVMREMLDKIEARAPGILKKSIISLNTRMDIPKYDDDPTIDYVDFLEAQIRWIHNDPILKQLDGISFFAPYGTYESGLVRLDDIVARYYMPEEAAARKPKVPVPSVSTYGLPISYDVGWNKLIRPYAENMDIEKARVELKQDVYQWPLSSANIVCFNPSQIADASEDIRLFCQRKHAEGKILLNSLAEGIRVFEKVNTEEAIYKLFADSIDEPYMDGISFDEFMVDWVVNAPHQARPAMAALKRLRADYPDKLIVSWLSGWWGAKWDDPIEKEFLEVLRDTHDLIEAEIYYRQTEAATDFPDFRAYIDAMESLAPGISKKTIIGLFAVEHPSDDKSDPAIPRVQHLENQIKAIRRDPVLQQLPGIAFFTPYRCYDSTLKQLDRIVLQHYSRN